MSASALHFEKVSYRYGSEFLFKNLDLNIMDKKITVILGKSGSGKTSLLQMINGLIRPQEGKVYLYDRPLDYNQIYQIRLQIGYAVQQVGLFPHLNVLDNITLPGKLTGWTEDQRNLRAKKLMELVSLDENHKYKYPHQISGGEQQRVGLCRAILLNPPLLLLDESFSSLDQETKQDIHNEVLKLQRTEPRCIVMVTHDQHEANKLGDVLLKLEKGRIIPMD